MANRKPAKPCSVAKEKDIHVFLTYFMERHVSSKILLCFHSTASASPTLHIIFSNCVFVFLFHSIGVVSYQKRKKKKWIENVVLDFSVSQFHSIFVLLFFICHFCRGIRVKGSHHCRQMNTLWNEKRTKLVHVLRVKQQLLSDYKDVRLSWLLWISSLIKFWMSSTGTLDGRQELADVNYISYANRNSRMTWNRCHLCTNYAHKIE